MTVTDHAFIKVYSEARQEPFTPSCLPTIEDPSTFSTVVETINHIHCVEVHNPDYDFSTHETDVTHETNVIVPPTPSHPTPAPFPANIVLQNTVPENTVPENTVPENTVPENTVPENTVPENTVPKNTVLDVTAPDDKVPIDAVPENTVPENTVPENTVPENTVPENTVPENTVQHNAIQNDATLDHATGHHFEQTPEPDAAQRWRTDPADPVIPPAPHGPHAYRSPTAESSRMAPPLHAATPQTETTRIPLAQASASQTVLQSQTHTGHGQPTPHYRDAASDMAHEAMVRPSRLIANWEVDQFHIPHLCQRLQSLAGDQLYRMATSVLHDVTGEGQVVAVTGVNPAEGRSTIAVALANVAASLGKRIALLDGHLSSPKLGSGLGIFLDRGWENVSFGMPLEDAAVGSLNEPFVLFPIGRSARLHPGSQIMEGAHMVLKMLKERFDLVLLDAGPLFTAAHEWFRQPAVQFVHRAVVLRDQRNVSVEQINDASDRLGQAGVSRISVLENFAS